MSVGAESQLASDANIASQRGVLGTLRHVRSVLADRWSKLSLGSQFALTAAAVILVGMFALGTWVNDRIRTGVVQNSAANAALYLVSFLEPHIQPMSSSGLPPASHEQIDLVFQRLAQQRGIIGVKVWGRGGVLVYSSDKQRTGQVFPESSKLRSAWLGNIEPEFDDLDDVESEVERKLNVPMLEVYAPMRDVVTKQVIAVAEVYEVASALQSELRDTFYKTVLALGSIGLLILASLSHIVARGSATIDQQREALSDRVHELSRLLQVNRDLQRRVANANSRAAESNELMLRRLGGDLHDGPAQLVAFSLLRLDALRPGAQDVERSGADIETIRSALSDSLKEIRSICAGIALPELRAATLEQAVHIAVANHEDRSKTKVALEIRPGLPSLSGLPLVICVYRLVQEGLNNALRHAGGKGQRVTVDIQGDFLTVSVADEGPGLNMQDREAAPLGGALGLRGLKDRIQAMGGEFEVASVAGQGTRLIATFPVSVSNLYSGADHG